MYHLFKQLTGLGLTDKAGQGDSATNVG